MLPALPESGQDEAAFVLLICCTVMMLELINSSGHLAFDADEACDAIICLIVL